LRDQMNFLIKLLSSGFAFNLKLFKAEAM
jgi:hypothetical protein